jgi:L-ribulokinase
MRDILLAVDVGTGSARAGVFDKGGELLARAVNPILIHRPRENHAEHDSEDIWAAVCQSVRQALAAAAIAPGRVAAIGFDATCSLVIRDRNGKQLSVSTSGENAYDTLVWLDHRALAEADFLTGSEHPILEYAGHFMSPEMEMPKLMWLKKNLPDTWERMGYAFDLADFLTWKATGSTQRSRCTLTAKWNYVAHEKPAWKADFLNMIGLGDLLVRATLPEETVPAGGVIGHLSDRAADDLGLDTGCMVAAGLIDAYAGALGVLSAYADPGTDLDSHFAMIAGTSSCIVAFSNEKRPSRGLWGPYFEAVFPGYWLVEAGQSATGALLDHVIAMHAAGGEPNSNRHQSIIRRIGELQQMEGGDIAPRLHVLPDFHGNRSPLADPHAVGVISGLTLDTSFDGLCRLYWRTCVSIAFGIRHVLETMDDYGYRPGRLHITGGHVRNPLLMQLYADVTGCDVVVAETGDAVLLGTAMSAAVGGGLYPDLASAGRAMDAGGRTIRPDATRRAAYDRDFRKYLAMIRHRAELDAIV